MWESLQRYRALEPAARKIFRRAVVLIPRIRRSLRARGFQKTQEWLQSRLPSNPLDSDSSQNVSNRVALTCRMVNAADRHGFVHPTCLEESLALWYLLSSQGIASDLRIGVRKQAEKFEAHAWVEHHGVALNQHEEIHRHYVAFEGELISPGEHKQ